MIWIFLLGLMVHPHLVLGQFVAKGDAVQISDKCYKITGDQKSRQGSIWAANRVDLSKPFELNFALFLGQKDADGADGMAFIFHNDPRGTEAKGTAGRGLGYGVPFRELNPDAIKPSVAVEFDTYFNGSVNRDIPQDHTTVVYNGDMLNPRFSPKWINPNHSNVEDNQCHDYKITWDPGTQELKLFFDGQLVFSHKDDIINKVFNGTTLLYYGFTGSTGDLSNEQRVCLQEPDSQPLPQSDEAQTEPAKPVTVEVLKNDRHSAGQPVVLSRVASAPQNGTAVISGRQIVYTPEPGFTGTDSFSYEVCEATSGRCAAKCATATVMVEVACKPLPPPPIIVDGSVGLRSDGSVTLTASPGKAYSWSTGATSQSVRVHQSGTYGVTVTTAEGCPLYGEVSVTVRLGLDIPSAFSPNGDRVNDTWEITNILHFPKARVEVFNRWGIRVYDTYGYRNDWDGTYRNKPLPIDTYFYVITLDRERKLTGPVSIVR